jgi:hypothetical protein
MMLSTFPMEHDVSGVEDRQRKASRQLHVVKEGRRCHRVWRRFEHLRQHYFTDCLASLSTADVVRLTRQHSKTCSCYRGRMLPYQRSRQTVSTSFSIYSRQPEFDCTLSTTFCSPLTSVQGTLTSMYSSTVGERIESYHQSVCLYHRTEFTR